MKVTSSFQKAVFRLALTTILISFLSFQGFAQLSGTYTIDPAGGSFATKNCKSFGEAVDSLLSPTQSVTGPVVFNIADGTYNEQIQLNQISGASAVNTITFQSASLDSTKVILTYSSSASDANWTFRLNGADYVILRKMTFAATGDYYGRIININGNARYDTIENCQFFGYNTTSSYDNLALIGSWDDYIENLVIQNNLFADGSFGLRLDGDSQSNLSPGLKILNNKFIGQSQYGMWLRYQDAPVVKNNIFNLDKDPAWGIRMEYCDNAFELSNNEIYFTQGDWGIYLYYCDGASLTKGQTANNVVSIQGIGGNSSGIYLYNCTYQNIYHNSVYLSKTATGTSSDNGAFGISGSSNIDIRNNIFANFGGFYAYNVRTSTNVTSDYNNYFATGNFLANWTNRCDDLAALRAANSSDANSVSVNPAFLSATDLHTTTFRLEGLGATDVGITTDIDGDARAGTFDMGADEFTGAGIAMAGPTYTIGGTTPDFETFGEATDSLFEVGISAPITFNVRDGSYNEQIEILPIDGTNATNTVTFQSETDDSSQVEISYNSGSANNYVLKFQGAHYTTFKKMTISATNATNSVGVWFGGNARNNNLLNCIITADITGTTYNGAVDSYRANLDSIVVANNLITGGRYGVILHTDDANVIAKGTKILNNEIIDQARSAGRGIYLRNHNSPEINDNIINDSESYDYYAINLRSCNDTLKILRNKITSDNTNGGIRLYECIGTSSKRGLIANNFVDIGGTSYAYGIYTYNSDFQNIFNNSVRITSSHLTYGRAFFNSNGSSNIILKNNIFSNFGGGYAFYTTGTTDIDASSDYNDYYTTGNYLAYWDGTNKNELSDFQTAATPREANSISANPSFVSSTDLHATSSFINDSATVLAEVTDDIDGEPRHATTPDIGADEFTTATAPLAGGTYTIGGTTPDYATFAAAVDDLNSLGIAGPVVFDVRNDTYSEQISIGDINGANETNTITFQSQSGDSSLVELTYAGSINYKYVVELIGTDYITFKNMTFSATGTTYSLVFYFRAGLNNVTISNCAINGVVGSGSEYDRSVFYAGNAVFTNLTIENNLISGGRSGIWLQCDNNNYSTGTRILNNSFSGQYYDAIYLRYHDAPKADSNYVYNSTGNYFWGIYLRNCSNDLSIQKNIINSTQRDGGIILYDCIGTTSSLGLVANNFVDIGGTSYAYGIHTTGSNYQRIYYNSVRITSTHTTYGRAFYNSNGSNIDVQNNVFSNFGGGYAYYTNSTTAITTSDYNDLFATGNNVGYWNGARTDLTAFQIASTKDAHSLSVNPVFVSATDMHATSSYIDSAGTVLAVITDDIDGEPRDATYPDIGADEFTPTEFPLAGEYTIGGTTPDYATFTLAVEDLNNLGVDGPVTFNVRTGTYVEQIELFEIAGASVTDTIIFQSETGDSSDVTLTYDAQSSAEDYIVKLTGTDYITFKSMSLIATDNTWATIVVLNGSVNNLNILNNIIYTSNSANSSVILSADGNVTNNILIKQNIIGEGGTGIYMNGNNSTHSGNVQIIDNIITDQTSYGIYLEDQKGSVILGNEISANDYSYTGIYLNDCDEDIVIKENRISNDNYSTGIYLYYCNGTLVKQGLIANNFVSIQGASYAYGIYMYYCEYQNIYYNSVNIASTYSYVDSKPAFYVSGGADINVKNNIFANTKGGYAYYINTTAAIETSDNNDLYSTTDIAYWDGAARTNLAALQSESGMDANSVSADPLFASETDLRTAQAIFHQAATPVSEVTDDIFGRARDVATPDIGAMEFDCVPPTFNVSVPTVCFGDSSVFTNNSTNVAFGSTYSWDWDLDFNPDTTFTASNTVIKHKFNTSGQHSAYLIISQIAGCNDYDTIYANVNPSPVLAITIQGAYCDSTNGQATVDVT
ncbi:MAG: right-handed parallel beta-helix repeat-containing protein, partial [Bacteroidales bacterium]|nr:right-handed parallel beta-helix repeat-containing protein [Bacteroidales bacterium]